MCVCVCVCVCVNIQSLRLFIAEYYTDVQLSGFFFFSHYTIIWAMFICAVVFSEFHSNLKMKQKIEKKSLHTIISGFLFQI